MSCFSTSERRASTGPEDEAEASDKVFEDIIGGGPAELEGTSQVADGVLTGDLGSAGAGACAGAGAGAGAELTDSVDNTAGAVAGVEVAAALEEAVDGILLGGALKGEVVVVGEHG